MKNENRVTEIIQLSICFAYMTSSDAKKFLKNDNRITWNKQ